MEFILILILAVISFFVLIAMYVMNLVFTYKPISKVQNTKHEYKKLCILCNEYLYGSEKINSKVLDYKNKIGSLVEGISYIYGCPHCDPRKRIFTKPRFCPVCKEELKNLDYVVARYFEKSNKRHVHVIGCTICRGEFSLSNVNKIK